MIIKRKKVVDRLKNYFLSKKGGRRIPYKSGSLLIKWFCGTSYARNKYFKKKARIFKTFLNEIGFPENTAQMEQEMLNVSFLKKWRTVAISNLSDRKFKKYVHVNNLDILTESHKKGKGVILVSSHYGFSEMTISIFPRIGFTDVYTMVASQGADSEKFNNINPNIEAKKLVFDYLSDIELFKVLMEAKHVLNDGGIIHLLGDGYHGKSSMTFPFIGKLRGFRGSYAELALSTDAEIIPVFVYPDKYYHISVDLYPPLDKGKEDQSREDRTRHIVKQYVEHMTAKWSDSPQFVNMGYMEKYLHHVDKDD